MPGGFTPKLRRSSLGVTQEAEFLASEHYMVKRVGVTIDSTKVASAVVDGVARKVVKKGTLLTKVTATGKYGPYDAAATDGRALITDDSGYLPETVDAKDGDVITGVYLHCSVLTARVTPAVTPAIRSGLAGRVIFQ